MSKIHLAIACALGVTGMAVAQAQTASEIVLQSFTTALVNGGDPYSGVIRDAAGNLYGTTYFGGTATAGVVYKLDTAGRQTVLHNFTGGADGANPYAGVVDDSAGNLYGTTSNGGAAKAGVVYKLDTAGHETVLYTFTGGADGGWPYAGMIRDPAGNFYGAGSGGGTAGWGVLFKLDATGQETVLYNFTGGADGAVPYGTPTRDPAGNLYGTTTGGGTAEAGVVYKLDTAGNYTVLYTFTGGADGGLPYPGVMRDSAGNLYGTTSRGGSFSAGVVYELNTGGQETVLYNFAGGNGMAPSGVIRDPAGNLYGTGPANAGVVYKLDTAGNYTAMYSFMGKADGGRPYGGVIFDSAGNLYGTTFGGGTGGVGVVYKLDAAGQETVLFGFPGATGGSCPHAGVIRDPEGNLYGTTERGGAGDGGVVYKLDTTGQETVLYTFTDSHGSQGTGVIRDPAGNLYGTTYYGGTERTGSVYKLDTAGNYTVLYSFTDGADGGYPSAGVILDPAGNLYGTTPVAGTGGWGVVYKLDTSGQETVLYSFTGGADGSGPSGVVRDAEGNLYEDDMAGRRSQSGRGVQSGSGRQRGGALHLHRPRRWGLPLRRCDPGLGRQPLRDHFGRGHGGARGRGVQAGCSRQLHGALQLHRRGRRRFAPIGRDPGLGRQSLRDYLPWRRGGRGRGLQTGYGRQRNGAAQFHGRRRWEHPLRGRDSRFGRQPVRDYFLRREILWRSRLQAHAAIAALPGRIVN